MICVSLGITDFCNAEKIAQKVQMLELRADLLDFSGDEYAGIIDVVSKSLFTFRPGGKTDEERLAMYRFAVENNVSYLDVEMDANDYFMAEIKEMIRDNDTELILSYHNYESTPGPDELSNIYQHCMLQGADICKIACMVNDYSDAARLLSLYQMQGRKVIIGMGEKGKIVRVASLLLGAEFTFAAPENGQATAPGQLSWREMEDIYKIIDVKL